MCICLVIYKQLHLLVKNGVKCLFSCPPTNGPVNCLNFRFGLELTESWSIPLPVVTMSVSSCRRCSVVWLAMLGMECALLHSHSTHLISEIVKKLFLLRFTNHLFHSIHFVFRVCLHLRQRLRLQGVRFVQCLRRLRWNITWGLI